MEDGVEIGVGSGVDMTPPEPEAPGAPPPLALRLLGPLSVSRHGEPLVLPPSRKVRALLAYLAATPRAVSRSHLCELLWDLPSDPRGELRWCLSKLRGVVDEPGRTRIVADGDSVMLDLRDADEDSAVDVRAVSRSLQQGLAGLPVARLEALAARLAAGDFLEGLELPRSPVFGGWLSAERRRLRAARAAVLEHWVRALPLASEAALEALAQWLAIAPFDRHAHERLLEALAAAGRLREGDEHLAETARRYESEGQDWAPIGHAWRAAKLRHAPPAAAVSAATAVSAVASSAPTASGVIALPPDQTAPARRASLAVMPFADRSPGVPLRGGLRDGLVHDIITRLAKLRSMFVIAEGTMFALADRRIDSDDAARRLDVDYVASGSLRRDGSGRLTVTVQLAQTRSAQVVWADEFDAPRDDTFRVLDEICNRIVASIAQQVELSERNRAILKHPNSLDAWEAHHRGLWHMFRFTREDNEQARACFEAAVRLDPTFARPHAGLSFTHFQDAFLGWREAAPAIQQAYGAAADGVMADEHDPSAHWALGRALWLQGRQDDGLDALRTSVALSPNFALGHYTLAFLHAQTGDPQTAIAEADCSRGLSPFDPLLFGMLASRALALLRLGRYDEAAEGALKAAARPNAHVHIQAIAMFSLALAGRADAARALAATIQRVQPGYEVGNFLKAFRLGGDGEALVRRAVASLSG